MKINSNKGMFLENIIEKSINYYEKNKIAIIRKNNIPIKIFKIDENDVIGKIYKKADVDYYGIYKTKFICIEAKQTNDDVFYLNKIMKHQWEFLKNINDLKGKSYLIIFFNKFNKFFLINFKKIDSSKKSINLQWCKKNAKNLELIFPGRLDFLKYV